MAHDNFTRWIEGKGVGLRTLQGINQYEILDPFELADTMGVHILSLSDAQIPNEIKKQIMITDPRCFDAGCIKLPKNRALILYNPNHAETRIRATIMEELSHLFLNHKGSTLLKVDGLCCRNYKKSEEKQAYAVGSAALMPMSILKKAKKDGLSKQYLANEHMVSQQLITYRENITRIRLKL